MSICSRSLWVILALLPSVGVGQAAQKNREKDLEVRVEVQFVDIADEVVEDLKQQGLLGDSSDGGKITFLDNAQMARFMAAVQNDIRSNVMQAPRMTTNNGRNTAINIVDEKSFVTGLTVFSREDQIVCETKTEVVPLGIQLQMRPTASADRRFVSLDLDLKWSDLVSGEVRRVPVTINATGNRDDKEATMTFYVEKPHVNKMNLSRSLVIPDRKTAVLPGLMRQCEVNKTVGPEFLKEIPWLYEFFGSTMMHTETHHLLVMVTPVIVAPQEKEEKQTDKTAVGEATICRCCCKECCTPILPAVLPGKTVYGEEPDEARILRALPQTAHLPGLYEESRDNIRIVTERVVDKLDPPRFYPLVGPAQMHHCHWRCTVYYMDTIAGLYPFSFRWTQPCKQIVYVDLDHLHVAP